MDDAAVPIGGEAFAALTVVFVLGMLLIVLWRAVAKTRAARQAAPARRRSRDRGDSGGFIATSDGGKRSDHDLSDSGSGSDGGGDGGGGGD